MTNLLRAELCQMGKHTLFRMCLLLMSAGTAVLCLFQYYTELQQFAEEVSGEHLLFAPVPVLGVLYALWVSRFLGIEYDFGTLRNKLIAGHSRGEVYGSWVLTCSLGCLLLAAVMLAVSGVMAQLLIGRWSMGVGKLAYLAVTCLLTAMVYGSLYAAITLNCGSGAGAVARCMLVVLGMTMGCTYLQSMLSEQEMVYEYVRITADGLEYGDLVPNSAYVSGLRRAAYELLLDLLPMGQNINLNNLDYDRCERWAGLSVLLTAAVTGAGYLGFRRRDLR